MASTALDRSSFSRRSATYTASTFTAFEYGSTYEYHGMYNIQGETAAAAGDQKDPKSSSETDELEDQDVDELLSKLSKEELAELSKTDPDVSLYFGAQKNPRAVNKYYLGFQCTGQSKMLVSL